MCPFAVSGRANKIQRSAKAEAVGGAASDAEVRNEDGGPCAWDLNGIDFFVQIRWLDPSDFTTTTTALSLQLVLSSVRV